MSLDLKTTFKSIALAGMVMSAPMAANDIQAEDKASFNTASLSSSAFKHSVAVEDYSDTNPQLATITAGRISANNDAMVIIYSGSDQSLQEKVHQASSLARNDRQRVVNMTVVNNYEVIGDEKIAIAFNGELTLPRDPALLSVQDMRDFIANTQTDLLIPSVRKERHQLAIASSPTVASNE